MYCTNCGRPIGDNCTCLKSVKIDQDIRFYSIIYIGIIIIPILIIMMFNILIGFEFYEDNIMKIGSSILTTVLIYFIVLDLLKIKNYSFLALFYNCHQGCSRSFKIGNKYLSICARCTGITFGLIFAYFIDFKFYIYLLLAMPLVIDGFVQLKTKYVSNNLKRLISGILFGPLLAFIYSTIYYYFLLLMEIIVKWITHII